MGLTFPYGSTKAQIKRNNAFNFRILSEGVWIVVRKRRMAFLTGFFLVPQSNTLITGLVT